MRNDPQQIERTEAVCLENTRKKLGATLYLISITLLQASHPQLLAQGLAKETLPASSRLQSLPEAPQAQALPSQASADLSSSSAGAEATEPSEYPVARIVNESSEPTPATIESDGPQSKTGNRYVADEAVVITYGDRTVKADHLEYDSDSGELLARGHIEASGGENQEHMTASRAEINLHTQTGRFYDVSGSVGVKASGSERVYTNGNPFLFSGKLVVKTGPQAYTVYNGSVTSCQLPHPDWQLTAERFDFDGTKAHASNSVFRLFNVPLLYLPYVTHPVDAKERQSGILIPVISNSSTKGTVIGEDVYFVLNRSMDLTLGFEYFSQRGFSEHGGYRYRGAGLNFAQAHFSALQDRGFTAEGSTVTVNQGGEDVTFDARRDFENSPETQVRVAANIEYLSSYIYREAFSETFNQAVSSDITSVAYGIREWNGIAAAVRADRYQGLKVIPTPTTAGEQIHILHTPSLDLAATEHRLGSSPIEFTFESSASGLKRTQPNFVTSGVIERVDVHPALALPLQFAGWNLRTSVGGRESFYSRGRAFQPPLGVGLPPTLVESTRSENRAEFETEVNLRAPVLERDFDSGLVKRLFGQQLRHTITPGVTYRYAAGVNNFRNLLRFDDIDVVSDTNEVEYGVSQKLYFHGENPRSGCVTREVANETLASGIVERNNGAADCVTREWIDWSLTQKYFFDPNFGGAIVTGRRNIFTTTLDLSGIAFLTEPRNISPLISRFRVRPTNKVDIEWDFDLDTGAKKFTSDNVYIDVQQGVLFGGLSFALLDAPGRFNTDGLNSVNSNFKQIRVLLGYGNPAKPGLTLATNAGLDLNLGTVQYAAVQTGYNWNCCGFSVEYRKYELGSTRNENAYRFSFTLANIGTAGNLRRAERLF